MPALNAFIVEDIAVIRDSLIATLEELAPIHVVGHAADAAGALGWLGDPAHRCDLVVIDIFLHRSSGIDVLRGLRDSAHPATRVVLTNYATPEMRGRCVALGANRLFDKSSEIDDLVAYCDDLAGAEGSPPTAAAGGPPPGSPAPG